jgi:hypothetical protein
MYFRMSYSSNISAEQRDIIEDRRVVVSVVLVVLKDAIPSSTQEDDCFCGGNNMCRLQSEQGTPPTFNLKREHARSFVPI